MQLEYYPKMPQPSAIVAVADVQMDFPIKFESQYEFVEGLLVFVQNYVNDVP